MRRIRVCLFVFALTACGHGSGDGPAGAPPGLQHGNESLSPGIAISDPSYHPRNLSPKVFTLDSATYAALDFDDYDLTLSFDISSQTILGTARIQFHQNQTSRPFFLLDGTVTSASVDGVATPFGRIKDPAGKNSLLALEQAFYANHSHELVLTYTLPSSRVSFTSGGVGFMTDYADLLGRFFERFGPAGYEDDTFQMHLHLKVDGATNVHQVFSNGSVTTVSPNEWEIVFPSFFSMSSLFVHLTDRPLVVNRFTYPGRAQDIAVTVYSSQEANVLEASRRIPLLFAELESDYGAFSYPSFLVYINDGAGGMEYSAATVTSIHSLGHELFHSWFARGTMPAEGRAGWIDEALAAWRDIGYARATSQFSRPATSLGNGSIYDRSTPFNCYVDGRALMSEFDALFASQGGLKVFLRQFIEKYRYSRYTTDEFRAFLEEQTGLDLGVYFSRYVYGAARAALAANFSDSLHPPPLTEAELRNLR